MEPDFTESYTKEMRTIDLYRANVVALYLFAIVILAYGIPFYFLWSTQDFISIMKDSFGGNLISAPLLIFLIMIVGIVLHELIHGITFSVYAKHGFKSIKFGFLVKMLTPYCHCKEPLKVNHYIIGALMPAIILGIIPALISLITGNIFLLLFAIFFTGAAAGDFLIVKLIWKEDRSSMVLDHPSEAGCYILKKI
ncbi:DUF3267 domain-containing protein [Sphingobacterium sp. PCS056]|jgi:hypothetical protein|uniref:DUF3267 domain-containing protein n=1 Tax=Sphingobacterium sp. PCS056 TaxID=2931400 RepID=UPI00200EE6F6|nr:DUF3267 domain-containing protein [Sphingobacterium sp. PCS056]UPZ38613.1 DUF3267 domain-containing protein [Sphingobacterium sp. PCS056]